MRSASPLDALGRAWGSAPLLRLVRSTAQKQCRLLDESLLLFLIPPPTRGGNYLKKGGRTLKFLYFFCRIEETLEYSADLGNGLRVRNQIGELEVILCGPDTQVMRS